MISVLESVHAVGANVLAQPTAETAIIKIQKGRQGSPRVGGMAPRASEGASLQIENYPSSRAIRSRLPCNIEISKEVNFLLVVAQDPPQLS